jgi:glucose-1-phosphatase
MAQRTSDDPTVQVSVERYRIAGVLLDVGGVLAELDGVPCLAGLLETEERDDVIHEMWMASPSVVAHETGRIGATEFAARVVVDLGLPVAPESFLEDFRTWPKGLLPGALELLEEIGRASCLLSALSNMSAEHWGILLEMGLENRFEQVYVSCEIGHLKPAAEAFLAALEGMSMTPSEVLFLDDAIQNVEAARALGIHARLARGPQDARSALVQYGVLRSSGDNRVVDQPV